MCCGWGNISDREWVSICQRPWFKLDPDWDLSIPPRGNGYSWSLAGSWVLWSVYSTTPTPRCRRLLRQSLQLTAQKLYKTRLSINRSADIYLDMTDEESPSIAFYMYLYGTPSSQRGDWRLQLMAVRRGQSWSLFEAPMIYYHHWLLLRSPCRLIASGSLLLLHSTVSQ